MKSRRFALSIVLAAVLPACGTVRETRPLAYPGDPQLTVEPIAAAIGKRGYRPACSTRKFCKFSTDDLVTVHFKVGSGQVVIAVDVADGKKLAPAELQGLIDKGMKLGEEIFAEARPAALALEDEVARRTRERERDQHEAAQRALALAKEQQELARGAQAPSAELAPPGPASAAAPQLSAQVSYADDSRRTAFKFVEPAGVVCNIVGDTVWAGSRTLEVPFRFEALPKVYYTFDCKLPSGAQWHQKMDAKDSRVTVVRFVAGAGAAQGAAPAAAEVSPMSHAAFSTLKASVEGESFSDGKLRIIGVAASSNWFAAAQVGVLVDLLTQSSDKVRVVEALRQRIVDRQNAHTLLSHFTFSDDKSKVQRLLGM
jgi:hypothetical protein